MGYTLDYEVKDKEKEVLSPFVEATGFPEEPMSQDQRDFYRAWAIACTGLGLICGYILMCHCGAGHHVASIVGFIPY